MEAESLEQVRARHRKELKDLQGRITSKKKNATKKTRKGVNEECAEMERQTRERQAAEVAALTAGPKPPVEDGDESEDEGEEEEEENDEPTQQRPNGLEKVEVKVTEKLEKAAQKLHISNANGNGTPSPSSSDHQEQQQSAGKKRNRQKERMARRAAEQEAAAQRAEEEASTMTDHRARESEYMKKMFATFNLAEKEIEPDGHCLFSAVADQLAQNGIPLHGPGAGSPGGHGDGGPPYKIVRAMAASYMADNADDFAPFLDEDLAVYLLKMKDTAEWGGQLELMALARRYGVEIRVVQDGRTEKIRNEGKAAEGDDDGEGEVKVKTLWLAYYRHGYGLGEHYNSLRKAT